MKKYIWVFILLISTFIYPSEHEDDDDFLALLCNEDHHAHDDMNALERLRFMYSYHNIAHIKWTFYDKNKYAIVARYRLYDRDSGDRFIALTKYLENGDIMVCAKKILHNTEAEVVACEADPLIVSELKRDIALFEVRFDDHKDRHYYCWQESDDSQ